MGRLAKAPDGVYHNHDQTHGKGLLMNKNVRRGSLLLALLLTLSVFTGCIQVSSIPAATAAPTPEAPALVLLTPAPEDAASPEPVQESAPADSPAPTAEPTATPSPEPTATPAPTATPCPVEEDGWYNGRDEVALYIHLFGHLPPNYITKKEAEKLGWPGGSLEPYAPGMSIGGDYFGNYQGLLPSKKGRSYHECDIDTQGKKKRGDKRIVYSNDGLIYYTSDHYESFTLLYGEE